MKIQGSKSVITLGALSAFLANSVAMAQPTAYAQYAGALAGLKNPTSSTLLADTIDPKQVYVLPPTAGVAQPTQFRASSANLGFCQEMSNLQGAARQLSQRIAQNADAQAQALPELKNAEAAYLKAEQAADAIKAQNTDLQKVVNADNRVREIEDRLSSLYDKQANCASDTPVCQQIAKEVSDLEAEKVTLTKDRNETAKKVRELLAKYNAAKAQADDLKTAYDETLDKFQKINDAAVRAHKALIDMYGNYGHMEGGFSTVNYNTGWNENMQTLAGANAGLGYKFTQIPTANAQFNASFIGAGSRDMYLAELPAILDYTVNGKAYVPGQDPGETPKDANGQPNKTGSNELPGLPAQLTSTLHLSLVGACPMIDPARFDIKKEAGVPVFGIEATYQYPSAFHMKVDFTYNLFQLYTLMKKSGSSSGFFSSSSWSSISENQVQDSTFKVNWESDDPAASMTLTERHKIEAEIKAQLMQEVLRQMATPVFDGKAQPGTAPAAPQHGAILVANGLQETCGFYSFWCTGGAWVFRILDGIFGSSESEENFRKQNNYTAEEHWNSEMARYVPGVTVFAPAN